MSGGELLDYLVAGLGSLNLILLKGIYNDLHKIKLQIASFNFDRVDTRLDHTEKEVVMLRDRVHELEQLYPIMRKLLTKMPADQIAKFF